MNKIKKGGNNRQVNKNIERFDDDFMFQLTKEESEEISRCQFDTLKSKQGYNIKYLPYVFTELGVSAAASVLHSDTAIRMSKDIKTIIENK